MRCSISTGRALKLIFKVTAETLMVDAPKPKLHGYKNSTVTPHSWQLNNPVEGGF